MATPVVTLASGGLPVTDVTALTPARGLPITEATNGRGTAVTKVASGGRSVIYSTIADYPPPVVTPGPEAMAFLARTTGLDTTHTNIYAALINGLVADGIWAKLDVLCIFATNSSANALLNLVSSSYTGTAIGSPTFTIDRGFTGIQASTSPYISSNFDPSIAPSPKLVQNSAHLSFWSVTSVGGLNSAAMGVQIGGANECAIYGAFTDNNAYFRINANGSGGVANTISTGHFLGSRTSNSNIDGYRNANSLGSVVSTSIAPPAGQILMLAENRGGGSVYTSSMQLAMASIGGALTATDAANLYSRLRTYMTAVGVP